MPVMFDPTSWEVMKSFIIDTVKKHQTANITT